ncbi:MAG: META domain-containing protein [Blastocatellia bacterium]|nr:META domain-containing protein [Blastocatellia bacterium]
MMKNTPIKIWILSIAVIAFTGAGVFAQRDRLGTSQWKLVQINGRAVTNSNAYFEIERGGARFTGDTGCNRMFGRVEVSSNRVNFSNIGTTKRMCKMMPGNVPEPAFVNALNNVVRYQRNGNTLELYDRRGRDIVKFKRMVKQAPEESEPAPARLEDKKWFLESIKGSRTLVPVKDAFVVFDPNKRSAGGNTGCNVFGGEYSATDKTIKITEIISTFRACIEDSRMNVEREFLDGLRDTARYEIRDGRLFLYRGIMLLLTLRGEAK